MAKARKKASKKAQPRKAARKSNVRGAVTAKTSHDIAGGHGVSPVFQGDKTTPPRPCS
jgi:hypothetical protein